MRLQTALVVIALLVLLGPIRGLAEGGGGVRSDRQEGMVKYFAGIAGVSFPFTLHHELAEEAAVHGGSYFRGTYRDGRLMRLERYIDGDLMFTHEYAYHEGGEIASAIVRSKGEPARTFRYDPRGNLVEDSVEEHRQE